MIPSASDGTVIYNTFGNNNFPNFIEHAENGEAGLNKVKDGGEGFYSAVLMDIQMPVMNGYEATRAIRGLNGEYYKKIPIIAMSANAYEEDVKEALDSGMNAHVAKPFEPDDLARTLKKHIQSEARRCGHLPDI